MLSRMLFLHKYCLRKERFLKRFQWKSTFKPFTAVTKTRKQNTKLSKRGKREINDYLGQINAFIYHKETLLSRVKNRKVKSFLVYKLISFNNGILKQFSRVNLEQFAKRFKLVNNSKSKIVGITPDYIGVNPSKPIKAKNFIIKAMKNIWVDKKHLYSNSFNKQVQESLIDQRIVYSGGYDGAGEHLLSILSPNNSKITDDEIFTILNHSDFKWFQIPYIDLDKPSDLPITTGIKLDTGPGHYFSKLVAKTKGKALHYTIPLAHQLLEEIRETPSKNYALWQVLGRAKDIKLPYENVYKEVSTRVVLNTEAPVSFLLCNFAQKISTTIMSSDEPSRFDIKDEFGIDKYHKYNTNNQDFDYYVDADWKNFDANVDSQFIRIAMSILLSNIATLDDYNKRISFYIINSLITKYIAIPPGIVVECNKAIPSGHPFTTLCNCFVNLIYWSIIGFRIYGPEYANNMEVTVYGDDALVWFKYNDKLKNLDDIIKDIGIKSDPIADKLYPCKLYSSLDEQPDFLKRRFNDVEIKWNTKKMFDRFLYQTRNRDLTDQVDVVFSYLQTAPFDDDLFLFAKNLVQEYSVGEDQLDIDDIDKYNKILDSIEQTKLRVTHRLDSGEKGRQKEMALVSFSHCEFKPRKYYTVRKLKRDKLLIAYFLGKNISLVNRNKQKIVNAIKLMFFNNQVVVNTKLNVRTSFQHRAVYVSSTGVPP